MTSSPDNNRTYRILHDARQGGDSVGAYNCNQSYRDLQLSSHHSSFPLDNAFPGPGLRALRGGAAHAAHAPIAVHLDHCIKPSDVELGLSLPFDSIMVDASCQDPEENVTACAKIVQSANAKGIAIEAEMGRIMGSGDALPRMERSLESLMTDPDIAKVFIKRTGVQFLASSFGNIHGHYGAMRAEDVWKVTLPSGVNSAVPDIALVLHRTHGVSDELFLEAAKRGVTMINLNQTVKKDYTDFTSRYAGTLELTELKAQGVAVYAFLSPSSP